MDSTTVAHPTDAASLEPSLSPLARSIAVFTRPTQAWSGLKDHAQWWFPTLVIVIFTAVGTALLHQRALVPMLTEAWDKQVASGQMQPEQVERMTSFMSSPAGMAITVGQQVVLMPIFILVVALLVWFGVGFVLGTNMKFRLALEVSAWSSLVSLPAYLLTMGLAWTKQTMRGIHVGFGILLPDMDPPSKLNIALGIVLDALGPLGIWYLVVGILGASALSGAKRSSVAWVLGTIYLVLQILLAAMAAMFTPTG